MGHSRVIRHRDRGIAGTHFAVPFPAKCGPSQLSHFKGAGHAVRETRRVVRRSKLANAETPFSVRDLLSIFFIFLPGRDRRLANDDPRVADVSTAVRARTMVAKLEVQLWQS